MPAGAPSFRELDPVECEAVLAAHHVGRIAYSYRDKVDIEPIHYVWSEGWLYGRTGEGTKLSTLAHNRWIAFEVDEVNALFDWRSVVVKGAMYVLDPDGEGPQGDEWRQAVQLLRRIMPEAFTEGDPTPDRSIVFRVHADHITGRAASS